MSDTTDHAPVAAPNAANLEPYRATITQLVSADLQHSQALADCLSAEYQALSEKDTETLHETVQRKSQHIEALNRNDQQRSQLLQQTGYGPNSSQWKQLVQQFLHSEPADSDLPQMWQDLKTAAEQCRQQNEINHRVIARSQQFVSKFLTILRGQVEGAGLYNNNGATTPKSSGSGQPIGRV